MIISVKCENCGGSLSVEVLPFGVLKIHPCGPCFTSPAFPAGSPVPEDPEVVRKMIDEITQLHSKPSKPSPIVFRISQ